jgi:hypothetical protein
MFLDAVNCEAYGNVFENVKYGVHAAGANAFTMAQQFKCQNNTFVGIKSGGCYIATTADKTQSVVMNNVFVGDPGSSAVICPTSGGWTVESYNSFFGFTVANTNHTFAGSDITSDPKLDSNSYRPMPDSPLIGAGAFTGWRLDATGKRFWRTPTIGAFEFMRPRVPRNT